MPEKFAIQLNKPIISAKLSDAQCTELLDESQQSAKLFELQKENLSQLCRTLQNATEKIKEFQQNIFKEYKEQIAKLSVEIARKVLMQQIEQGDYKIDTIIKEALKDAPTYQNLIVHLNPEDLSQYQKVGQNNTAELPEGIEFTADSTVGRAECMLETPKGIVELSIDENLDRIAKALGKVE